MKNLILTAIFVFCGLFFSCGNENSPQKPPVPVLEKLSFTLLHGQPIDGMGLRVKELFQRVEFIAQNTPLKEIRENFDPQLLVQLDSGDEDFIRYFMLSLRHEYRHYEQYLTAEPWQKAVSMPRKRSENPWTPDECEYLWAGELDASTLQCELAVEWGMPDVIKGDTCKKVRTPQFSRIIFSFYAPGWQGKIPECNSTWKKIAHSLP
ncbi:MAG: hypothetical protein A3F54_03705 [Candidatus Kerfeldbacteria bacterium RIFCSPHIGHO2_12_FULL_48_17]|uniref:Uncharacterized protein n=1 Tax=Candidatus Kerfeldbacteria bacterium RIFCSPHIGHO2_12_FULL_48_17 TaxID=1798542 RepID=A0A1G2AYH6_9BACT|nr:MAG: hypothetical protein A3F54_03705 [Candidatus Kerfeldbacteria bacterium RIFCSPHIGHO2_12_FULL_48_17]